jgi:hypothetical protein
MLDPLRLQGPHTSAQSSFVLLGNRLRPAVAQRPALVVADQAAKTRSWWYVMLQMPEVWCSFHVIRVHIGEALLWCARCHS